MTDRLPPERPLCPSCQGSGHKYHHERNADNLQWAKCPDCNGTGWAP